MDFQVGDQVVHWSYGPGEVILLDEKEISGQKTRYYVVRIRDLTLWVPAGDSEKSSLRLLTPADKFEKLFTILSGPGEPLSGDRMERKMQLSERMREGGLESICKVIRDLYFFKHTQKMNDQDVATLKRAETFFLTEWTLSLPVPISQAEEMLKQLLTESLARSK